MTNDPRSRIFVGQGFRIKPSMEGAIEALVKLLKVYPRMIALLEFTSRGRHRRQIDCALVGPGGIDLIEIKNKRGRVLGSPEGEWTVEWRGLTETFFNLKNGVEENPFDQARKTADDLRDWLMQVVGHKIWVTPLVWMPSADPTSQIAADSYVRHAVGVGHFPSQLRCATRAKSAWGAFDYLELPRHFQLKPLNLAFLRGCVIESVDHSGVSNVTVLIRAGGEEREVRTDEYGQFDFAVDKGMAVEVAVVVPDRYTQPPVLTVTPQLDYQDMGKIVLTERPRSKTEEEIREEERARLTEEMRTRLEGQAREAQGTYFQMGLVIDDLNRRLRDTLLHLAERERMLKTQQTHAEEGQLLPLPVQVQRSAEIATLQRQRERVTQTLHSLTQTDPDQTQEAVRQGVEVLSDVAVTSRLALSNTRSSVLPVKAVQVTACAPMEVPAFDGLGSDQHDSEPLSSHARTEDDEIVDAQFQPFEEERPTIAWEAQTAPSSAAPSASKRAAWPWALGIGAVAALGVGWTLFQASEAGKASPAEERAVAVEAVDAPLPGKPVDEVHDSDLPLPGVPVSEEDRASGRP